MNSALGAVQTAFWGIITFSILVVLHEMGHFLAARSFGVKTHEFMVGLPGPALRFHTRNMDWGITAVPLGGYVRIAGMEPGEEDDRLGDALIALRDAGTLDEEGLAQRLGIGTERAASMLTTLEDWKAARVSKDRYVFSVEGETDTMDRATLIAHARSFTYRGQSTPRRITILAMGVLTNLLVAILTFIIVLSVWGYFDLTLRVDSVGEGTPALAAGLQVGDTLVAVDGETFADWNEFQALMQDTLPGESVTITVERGGNTLQLPATLADKDGHGYLGVGPTAVQVRPTILQSLTESLRYVGLVFGMILSLFNPSTFSNTVQNFTGVIGVSVMAEEAAEAGPLSYATLIAMLSLSLGAMNILPVPPLDGGKIALEIVERIRRKPLSRAVTLGFSAIGAVMLFSLIGYIMYLDIIRFAT
ncbi:MAG: site-2 protease family protein [Coriobacteriia bacterium]|nr:site-2 protease family protein [Coriobacteriia bacterium]